MNYYKDASPQETLDNIRQILNKHGLVVEEEWNECLDNLRDVYSLGLSIKNTCIYSNGKGFTKAQAQVSTYAELFERLQNMIYFKMNCCAPFYRQGDSSFYFVDEYWDSAKVSERDKWYSYVFSNQVGDMLKAKFDKCTQPDKYEYKISKATTIEKKQIILRISY